MSEVTTVPGRLSKTTAEPHPKSGQGVACTVLPNLTVRAVLAPGTDLSEATVAQLDEQLGALRGTLSGSRKVAVVLQLAGITSVSRTARAAFASLPVSSWAIVGETPVDRLLGHVLLSAEAGSVLARYFTSEGEALEWLASLDGG